MMRRTGLSRTMISALAVAFAFVAMDVHSQDQQVDANVRRLFPEFFPPNVQHSIPLDEIAHGGPPKDGIPALTRPKTVSANMAGFLTDADRVIGVELNGEARAYPIKIMTWHEIVNDTLGGRSIAVTYCPLCGTGIVFDARIDGDTKEFGVSGLLHNNDLLMYDRHTESPSLWQQALGQAVVGPATGAKLTLLPAVHAQWSRWVRDNPNTSVVSADTGYARSYDRDPYAGYASTDDLLFQLKGERTDLPRKTWVFGLIVNGDARAYRLDMFDGAAVLNDRLGETNVVLIADDGEPPAIRAYQRGETTLAMKEGALTDEDGASWTVTEDALIGPNDTTHPRQNEGFTAFWFAWSAFYPHTTIFANEPLIDPSNKKLDQWGRVKQTSP